MSVTTTKAHSRELFCVILTSETTYAVAPFGSRDTITYKNASATACTLTCPTGTTIDGASTFTLDGYAAITLVRDDETAEWKATESYTKEELADTFTDAQTFQGNVTIEKAATLTQNEGVAPLSNITPPATLFTTTSAGVAFTNQPANDGIEVVSASAADTTQTVTIIGTTTGTDDVVVETVTLNGTTFVPTVKTDWGVVLAVKKSAVTAGTVTVREASGDQTITAGLTAAVLSVGVKTVAAADQAAYGRVLSLVASGATTKQLGLQGTNTSDAVIYDSQALTGTTAALSNSAFRTVTEIYTGDLEATRTATVTNDNSNYVTLPTIKNGLLATGSVSNNFSGSTGTFKTSSGANTLSGIVNQKVIATPVAATGAAGGVAGAAALGSANIVAISSDGATKGVKLNTSLGGEVVFIINTSATAANLFAASGGTINGGAANAGCAIPASKGVIAISTAADTWIVSDLTARAGAAA